MATVLLGKTYFSKNQNKTFTAPDGKVYVDKDGTILLRPESKPITTSEEKVNESGGGGGDRTVKRTGKTVFSGGVDKHAPEGKYYVEYTDGSFELKDGDEPTPGSLNGKKENELGEGGEGEDVSASIRFEDTAAFNSAAFRSLSAEDQEMIKLSYGAFSADSEDDAQLLLESIEKALELANPFFKAQLLLAKADIIAEITRSTSDFEFGSAEIKRIRDDLLKEIGSIESNLTLEEQAEISQTLDQFDRDILDIADSAAEAGVTFGTGAKSREQSFKTRAEKNEDIIQSTKREANFKREQLKLRAASGEAGAQAKLEEIEADKGFNLGTIGRKAEEILGTDEAKGVGGLGEHDFVGGVEGTVEGDRKTAIRENITKFFEIGGGVF